MTARKATKDLKKKQPNLPPPLPLKKGRPAVYNTDDARIPLRFAGQVDRATRSPSTDLA